jgi:Tn3 transposase DDE domain
LQQRWYWAKAAAKDRVYDYRIESNQNLQKAGQVLKLFTDDSIAENTPFRNVQATAFGILERQKLDFVADHIATNARFDETAFQWDHIDTLASQFKRHLRPILQATEFAAISAHAPLIKAVEFLKAAFRQGKSLGQYRTDVFPVRFIPAAMKRYLFTQNAPKQQRVLPDRYEFLVYRLLRQGLQAGDISCRDSVRFRSFEDDLLDDQRWQQKDKLMAEAGLVILQQPIQAHLAELGELLEARIAEVNRRIAAGENEHFQIKRRGPHIHWTLPYPRASESVNHPFFDALKQVDIASVLHFVDQHCRFMDAFDHVLGRYVKQEADKRVIVACLIAWATNLGLGRMGEISDIGYHRLAGASANFIRLETLKEREFDVRFSVLKSKTYKTTEIMV